MKELLMIFTYNPVLEKSSNNFHIEEKAALENYTQRLQHIHSITKSLDKDKYVFYDKYVPFYNVINNKSYQKFVQFGCNREEKILNAFIKGFIKGYDSIVMINTDFTNLTSEIISDSFIKLQSYDCVLGPSSEGNFYLIGMKQLKAALFECKVFEGKSIHEEALSQLKTNNFTFFEHPVLKEADKEQNFSVLKTA